MAEHLFLSLDEPTFTARIHPVVVLTILDHHNRRNEEEFCVVGSLLGNKTENVIEIKSAFGIPHSETDEDLNFDMEYHRNMLDLHLKANPDEILVGWYSSASVIDENSAIIHDFYWKEMGEDSISPVHLTVDSEVYGSRMEITPFIAEPKEKAQQTLGRQFFPIDYEIDTSDTEQGCLAALMKTKNEEFLKTGIDTEAENLTGSLNSLLNLLTIVSSYVDDVVEGKREADKRIGRILSNCINSLPQISAPEFENLLETSVQDKLTVVYLASVTKTQLALAERLQTTL